MNFGRLLSCDTIALILPGESKKYRSLIKRKMQNKREIFTNDILLTNVNLD